MEQHRKTLAIIYIVTSALQILGVFLLSMLLSTILSFIGNEIPSEHIWIMDLVTAILKFLPWILISAISIPSIIAGVGLLNNQGWALIMALILGCLKLFSFPIGTAIGIYAIWVYVESNKETVDQLKVEQLK
jgi:hypothetical protein